MNITDKDIERFNTVLLENSTYDFSDYSEKSLKRRISKILLDTKLEFPEFVAKLQQDPYFLEQSIKNITVNTTELFRDPSMWHSLRYRILPKYKNHKTITIWHAGCSTGQEVYSMLIMLHEMGLQDKVKIFASDLNTDVIDKAKRGEYRYRFNIGYLDNFDKALKENPYNFEEYHEVPYKEYFAIDKEKDTILMHDFLREIPSYRKFDLVKDTDVTLGKFDIILCRNVMIYFNFKLQNQVVQFFHKHLYDDGHLILGKQETIRGGLNTLFEKTHNAYLKINNATHINK